MSKGLQTKTLSALTHVTRVYQNSVKHQLCHSKIKTPLLSQSSSLLWFVNTFLALNPVVWADNSTIYNTVLPIRQTLWFMQKQMVVEAKTIYMSLRKQGQHLHLSLWLPNFRVQLPVVTCPVKPFFKGKRWLSPVFLKWFTGLLLQMNINNITKNKQQHFYHISQEGVLSSKPPTFTCQQWQHHPAATKHVFDSTPQCPRIKDCINAHASVQPMQLFLSTQQ